MNRRSHRAAFSLVELLVSISIIAVLLSLLIPALSHARRVSYMTVCASNLRQIGMAWHGYMDQNNEKFPECMRAPDLPEADWSYGGVKFLGESRIPTLDERRPVNRHLSKNLADSDRSLTSIFRCPADRGVFDRDPGSRRESVLRPFGTCYETWGTSYRANRSLLADNWGRPSPIRLTDVQVSMSRILFLGDAAWYYATLATLTWDINYEASWHGKLDAGNMLAGDNSVRFLDFRNANDRDFTIVPLQTTESSDPGRHADDDDPVRQYPPL